MNAVTLPLVYNIDTKALGGAYWSDIEAFCPGDPLRQVERASIRAFMEQARPFLRGRVLDFGAGTSPYKGLVSGEHVPVNQGEPIPDGPFDVIMCNQVMQYLADPETQLHKFRARLNRGGRLVMTYPTPWPEVEAVDLQRFTEAGMTRMLLRAEFTSLAVKCRAELVIGANRFALGYGVVCTRG